MVIKPTGASGRVPVTACAYSPNGRYIAGAPPHTACRLFPLPPAAQVSLDAVPSGHEPALCHRFGHFAPGFGERVSLGAATALLPCPLSCMPVITTLPAWLQHCKSLDTACAQE